MVFNVNRLGRAVPGLACAVFSVALASAGMAQAPAPRPVEPSLAGAWKVIEVDLAPGQVHALPKEDPAYIGAVLELSAAWLAWQPRKGGTFGDVCMAPSFDGGKVQCGTGTFGPPGSAVAVAQDRMTLGWYDGTKLVLQKIK